MFFGTTSEDDCDSQPDPCRSSFETQAVDESVFDGVAQGVVGVVGGVRGDQHIRQLLQPQQQLVLNGPLAVVGVEDSFLAFEDIQRRAAESAAFQGREKGIGIEK